MKIVKFPYIKISFQNNINPTIEIGTFESFIKYLMYNSMNKTVKFDIYRKLKYKSIFKINCHLNKKKTID